MNNNDNFILFSPEEIKDILWNKAYLLLIDKELYYFNGYEDDKFLPYTKQYTEDITYTLDRSALDKPVRYFPETDEFEITGDKSFPKFKVIGVVSFRKH